MIKPQIKTPPPPPVDMNIQLAVEVHSKLIENARRLDNSDPSWLAAEIIADHYRNHLDKRELDRLTDAEVAKLLRKAAEVDAPVNGAVPEKRGKKGAAA